MIEFCIGTGRLYESTPYHNAIFVGLDKFLKPKYANLRGIDTSFMGDANGSDKHYSFNIPAKKENATLHLFESAIDLLSFATLQIYERTDWQADHLLSLAGVYRPKNNLSESKLPASLHQYLTDYPRIKNIILRLDNDRAGLLAARAIATVLPPKYTVSTEPPLKGKDYNDFLCIKLGIPITNRSYKNYQRNHER